MCNEICRAFTFINFHIPFTEDKLTVQYSTMGFFDGLLTEKIQLDYMKSGLKQLWKYSLRKKNECDGQYSHQNIFCFSKDEWNACKDDELWEEETNERYPLTFVVFLQMKEYFAGEKSISEQCQAFSRTIKANIEEGMGYAYGTVDKNDFVVCIKCAKYKDAVKAIKELHQTGENVVYSYTIFSVATTVLNNLNSEKFPQLYEQYIDSICLKGIANSYYPDRIIALDRRYHTFYRELVEKLYGNKCEEEDHRVYDILGDEDFHLVARNVNLGKLLEQFREGELLCYKEKRFRFYFFSSNLVLNMKSPEDIEDITGDEIRKYEEKFQPVLCDEIEKNMQGMLEQVKAYCRQDYSVDEKTVTYCCAIQQLLQALRALEMAPTKQYDFFSLYHPFSLLVEILSNEMIKKGNLIMENKDVYDFIHKISMNLHGSLRTDIRFFQVKDFNVTVHYAPAKLRAFYSIWILELSRFYSSFHGNTKKRYSFIFAPGMFRGMSAKSLFDKYESENRLVLITVPERQLYAPKWLAIILAHEVSHFAGHEIRNRKRRHEVWMDCCVRVLALEWKSYQSNIGLTAQCKDVYENWLHEDKSFYEASGKLMCQEEEELRWEKYGLQKNGESDDECYAFHSRNSKKLIREAFRQIGRKYLQKMVTDETKALHNFFTSAENMKDTFSEQYVRMKEEKELEDFMYADMPEYFNKFQCNFLPGFLELLSYLSQEGYADLITILTLNLNPSDYLLSFVQSELGEKHVECENENRGSMLIMRIAIVEKAVCRVVERHSSWLQRSNSKFYCEWNKDVIRELATKFSVQSVEGIIAVKIYGYDTRIRDCLNGTKTYSSIYDSAKEYQTFLGKDFDFCNDCVINEALVQYLVCCADTYLDNLENKKKFGQKRDRFAKLFSHITNESPIILMQEIEQFLYEYEMERGMWDNEISGKNEENH